MYESDRLKAVPFIQAHVCEVDGLAADRWVFPAINASWYIQRYFMARIIAKGNVLEFVEEKNFAAARCLGRIIQNYRVGVE